MAKLRELYEQRHPLYEETAHYCVDTGRPSVSTLVNMIMAQLGLAGSPPSPGPP
jgi:shikimate kinase